MPEDGFTIEWPLWGATLGDRPVGFDGALQIHDSFVYQPSWVRWAAMESSAVEQEYFAQFVYGERMGTETPRLPPPCIIRFSAMDAAGEPSPPLSQHGEVARAVVTALRLHGSGDIIDPAETGTYVSEPSGLTRRQVEVFRCAPYSWAADRPYLIGPGDIGDLEYLQSAVRHVTQDARHAHAAIALENFVLSFGFALSPAERALHRFIALEALLGPFGDRKADVPFAVRAANAASDVAVDAATWLRSAKALRNAVAHEIHDATPSPDDLDTLEGVTRGTLLSYLAHISGSDPTDPVESFNLAVSVGPHRGARHPVLKSTGIRLWTGI